MRSPSSDKRARSERFRKVSYPRRVARDEPVTEDEESLVRFHELADGSGIWLIRPSRTDTP